MTHHAFGTEIASNLDLGRLPLMPTLLPLVTLRHRLVSSLGHRGGFSTRYSAQGREVRFSLAGRTVQLRIEGLVQFSFLLKQSLILCTATSHATVEQVRYWFLQKALPLYLLLSDTVEILHASAVEIGGRIVGFLAPSGTGKSTLLRQFLHEGHPLVADEHLVVLAGTTTVLPTLPYFRPKRDLESLGERSKSFCTEPRPLEALYLLERGAADAAVAIEPLTGATAVASLCQRKQFEMRARVYPASFAHLPATRLRRLAALATSVPVKKIAIPRSLGRLPEVYAAIRHDLEVR